MKISRGDSNLILKKEKRIFETANQIITIYIERLMSQNL